MTSGLHEKPESYWRERLSSEQYRVLRERGTEAPFSGAQTDTESPGMYHCVGCGAELFSSGSKFHSGSGWPSFFAAAGADAVELRADHAHGMRRTEVVCARCGGHLGHLFDDGPPPTRQRYCINSCVLKLQEETNREKG